MTPTAGVAVPPGDPRALADALIALLTDEPRRRRLGEQARLLAEDRYSWETLARRLLAVYERALGRRQSAVAA